MIKIDQYNELSELSRHTGKPIDALLHRAISDFLDLMNDEESKVMTDHDRVRLNFGRWAAAHSLDQLTPRACRDAFSAIRQDILARGKRRG